MADGPLVGFRILDLSQVVSGPFCTMQLGDLGADVIKIEPPEGDSTRLFGRPTKGGVTASFLNFNRNKRSIVVDLKKEHGRDLVRRLAVKADALVENNRPGVADRLGIGYGDVRRLNPKIIYCSICGFGPKGQYANAPAYDPVIQGFSGMAFLQGGREGRPTSVKMALADKISGMTAALSIVSALHAARNRGVGQYIRVAMTEAMMAFTANDATYLGYTFQPDDEFKDKVPKSGSLDPFKTSDGWVTIAPFTDEQWERLCAGLGHPEWWQIESRADRMRAALRGIAKQLPERETAHWLKVFEEADVPHGPVHSYDTLFTEPEVLANENFTVYEHPQAGQVRTVNPGMRFSETPARMWRTPPRLGEHSEEVLREAGFERDQIEELRKEKIIN
jgi:crotonobetainyl-CoA:carnitine CoA-transferase CaiB-like acyl-CoA transferase